MGKKDTKVAPDAIDIDKIDLDRMKEQVTDLPSIIEYAHSRSSALINPEDQGKLKGRALEAMHHQTSREFEQILAQMQPLVEQMNLLKKRVYLSETIYTSHIPFEPTIGGTYHLYRKKDGSTLLSIIGPKEWGKSMPYESYEGSVKLLPDHTWEVVE